MKKLISLTLALIMALSLVACGKKEEAAPANPYNTKTPGVLTVATSPDYAPYEFYAIGESGEAELAGFDIALIKYVADYLKLELDIVPMDFAYVLPAGTAIGLDKRFALELVQGSDVMVEYDKLIDRQLERAAITTISGFAKVFREASRVLEI